MEEEIKPLARWHFELKSIGKRHWAAFYESFLGVQPSNFPRFYRTLALYGYWPLFDAIIESSDKKLDGDPLNYVIVVAKNKFKESQKESDSADEYVAAIKESQKSTSTANKNLERRIRQRKKKK